MLDGVERTAAVFGQLDDDNDDDMLRGTDVGADAGVLDVVETVIDVEGFAKAVPAPLPTKISLIAVPIERSSRNPMSRAAGLGIVLLEATPSKKETEA